MVDDNAVRSDRFQDARRQYSAVLSEALSNLYSTCEDARAAGSNRFMLKSALRQAHNLRGSAGAYGQTLISISMERAEHLLETLIIEEQARVDATIWRELKRVLVGAIELSQSAIAAVFDDGTCPQEFVADQFSTQKLEALSGGNEKSVEPKPLVRVFLVEDDIEYAIYVRMLINQSVDPRYELSCTDSLSTALEYLTTHEPDVILLDLSLPDSDGLQTLIDVLKVRRSVPIVILTASDNAKIGIESVSRGAQDYLVKQHVSGDALCRSIRYAIERGKAQDSRMRLAAIEDFMAVLAHDLQVPLIGAEHVYDCFLAGKLGGLDGEQTLVMQSLKESNTKVLQLVQKLLEVHRYESPKVKLRFESIDLHELIAQSLIEFGCFIEARHIKVRPKYEENLNQVCGDRAALRLLIVNLLDNAIKFSPTGDTITITAENAGENVIVRLHNYGNEISPDDQERLFQQLWQGVPGKKYVAGTGIGLFLCHRIVSLHKGNIICASDASSGTMFSVVLPRSTPENQILCSQPCSRA